ncbi:MAG: tetratricopeptide repeat protein [Magnetococcales bacterium]|nr:tetratricopeptide repeat protein [Magnetococcales bacterium]
MNGPHGLRRRSHLVVKKRPNSVSTSAPSSEQSSQLSLEVVQPYLAEQLHQQLANEKLTRPLLGIRNTLRAAARNVTPDLNLGSVLEVAVRWDEVRRHYLARLEKSTKEIGHFNTIGRLLAEHGWLVEAEAAFRRGLSTHPDSVKTYYNLANLLRDQGREEEARLAIVRAGHIRRRGKATTPSGG